MLDPWSVVTTRKSTDNEEELKQLYGEEAIVSRVGDYNLIHLDNPGSAEIERRIREFDPEDLFHEGCPLCRMMRGRGLDVVFMRRLDGEGEEWEEAGEFVQ